MTIMKTTDENKVYVACLACYNEGKLNGKWMNADELDVAWENDWLEYLDKGDGEIHDERILCDADAIDCHEEWAIHDYEGDIHRLGMGEHPSIPDLIEVMRLMDDEPSMYVAAYLFAEELLGKQPSASEIESLTDVWELIDDVKDWAYESCKDCGYFEEPGGWSPISYIDWQRVGDDMLMDYSTFHYGEIIYAIHCGESIA
jgi:antirestriction protein